MLTDILSFQCGFAFVPACVISKKCHAPDKALQVFQHQPMVLLMWRADSIQWLSRHRSNPDALSPILLVGADWVTTIADRVPLSSFAEDGTAYNSNLPSLTEGWW